MAAAPVKLSFGRDIQSQNAYAPSFSQNKFSAALVNGSEQTFTIPADFERWVIALSYQPGSSVWVSYNSTAAIPVGNSFAATTSELNPGARSVFAGDVIHLITANASADVGVILYALL